MDRRTETGVAVILNQTADGLASLRQILDPAVRNLLKFGQLQRWSLISADLDSMSSTPREEQVAVYRFGFIQPLRNRCTHIQDALTGLSLLFNGAASGSPTRSSPSVLARSILETGAMARYHCAGDLETRLLRAYASLLSEDLLALQALSEVGKKASEDARHVEDRYLRHVGWANTLGFDLVTHRRHKVAGVAKITEVRSGDQAAQIEPVATRAISDIGNGSEFAWRLSSGLSHGRPWAVADAIQDDDDVERLMANFNSALTTALRGTQSLVESLDYVLGRSLYVPRYWTIVSQTADLFR